MDSHPSRRLRQRALPLYDQRADLKLDAEALQVLTLYYRQFVHAGANLSDKDKTRLQQINKQDASFETDFQQKLVAGTDAVHAMALGQVDNMHQAMMSGEQTRLSLAKAMLNRPRLLLLDEPTASIDPSNAREQRSHGLEVERRFIDGAVLRR